MAHHQDAPDWATIQHAKAATSCPLCDWQPPPTHPDYSTIDREIHLHSHTPTEWTTALAVARRHVADVLDALEHSERRRHRTRLPRRRPRRNRPSTPRRLTMNLHCPLCDWTQEAEATRYTESNLAASPGIATALGMPADALLSIHLHQARRRDETTIEHHLGTHGPHDWLPALMDARRSSSDGFSLKLAALIHNPEQRVMMADALLTLAASGTTPEQIHRFALASNRGSTSETMDCSGEVGAA